MPPTFPPAERVELAAPPLELVICQVRFPTVLELAAGQPPADFQRRVRSTYPMTRGYQTSSLEASTLASPHMSLSAHWAFDDPDSEWTVTLGAEFLSLEAKQYRRFEEFITRFLEVLDSARQVYSIDLRQRLGLRYLDRITQLKHPSLPRNWPRKVRREIIPLRSVRSNREPQLGRIESRFFFSGCFLSVRSLYVDAGFPGISHDELVLDFDCYTEERGVLDDIDRLLREFREICYRAFRWSIGDLIRSFPRANEGEDK